MSLRRITLLLGIGLTFCYSVEISAGKEENWLQKNIEEQQKLQANQKASANDKINPFQSIEKPNPEKIKAPEPFTLIRDQKPISDSKPLSKIEAPRPINTDTSFKPAISAMSSDSFYQQLRENESRALVERSENSNKSPEDFDSPELSLIEKTHRDKIQQNLNSKSSDKLFENKFEIPGNFDHPNLAGDTKNPYLYENKNRPDSDRDNLNSTSSLNHFQTIQLIKPIETPQMIENTAINRSIFENQNGRSQNQNNIYNQMMTTPGTGKNRLQDPNDFLRR